MSAAGHPTRTEEITAGWVTRALRDGGECRDSSVTEIEVTPVGGVGVGFLSGTVRVGLTYDRAEPTAPASVVVKLPAAAEPNRRLGDSFHAYEREVRFYREIAPRSGIRVPRCYYTALDPEAGVFVLVIEDLSGLTSGDQVKGLTVEQARAAIDAIAPFHAQWWNHPELAALTWMPLENLDIHHLFAQHWPAVRYQLYSELTPEELAVGDRLNWQGDQLADLVAPAPRTIVHWDYRADNLIFGDLHGQDPVVVLDWQLAQRSMGAFDVARVLCGSVPPDEQRGRHRELVARWHELLVEGGVKGYSAEQAWNDFLKGLLLCLYNPVAFRDFGEKAGKRGKALVDAMTHRFFRAAVECDACRVLGSG